MKPSPLPLRSTVLLLLVSICITISAQNTEYKIELTRHTGTMPTPMRSYIWKKYYSQNQPKSVPKFLSDYKTFAIPFTGSHNSTSGVADSILAICGIYNGDKIIVIDANNNRDLRDDKIFRFAYDRDQYLKYASTGIYPDEFQIDKTTKVDKHPGNEIFINYKVHEEETTYVNQVFVEVIPNFIVYPNPSAPDYEEQLSDFDYTFMLSLAEYRKGEIILSGIKYDIFLQQESVTKLFDVVQCYAGKEKEGFPDISYRDVNFYPDQKIEIGPGMFDIIIDYKGENAILKQVGSKSEYNDSVYRAQSQLTPFKRSNFLDNSEVTFLAPKDKPTLIHFWGSWCGPCKKDMPVLGKIWSNYGNSLDMIGIAAEHHVDLPKLKLIAKKFGISWPQITDNISEINNLSKSYNIGIFPTYIVVSSDGTIVSRTSNIDDIDEIFLDDLTK